MTVTARFLALAVAVAALPTAAAASADSPLTADDRERLARYETARAAAISEAQAGGEAAYLADLEAVLAGDPQPIRGVDLRGSYRCRSAQLGGIMPVVVYGWFACVIEEDDIGYRLVKTSGSQRFTGHVLDDDETHLIFWGAGHYADEAPRRYGDDHARDLVGKLVKVGPARYRLEMPLTKFDSKLEIIELRRK